MGEKYKSPRQNCVHATASGCYNKTEKGDFAAPITCPKGCPYFKPRPSEGEKR